MVELICVCLYAFVFLTGLCIGSFLNVLVYRMPRGLDFVSGRSMCPRCGHRLRGRDMVPVLSWLLLRGKCRDCGGAISPRYPAVELAAGGLFVLCFAVRGFTPPAVLACCVAAILLTVALIDRDTLEIPNGLLIALAVPALASLATAVPPVWEKPSLLIDRGIGMLAVSVPMALLTLVVRDSFGGGDVKLMAVCGFLLGWRLTLLAAFAALLTGGVAAIVLLATKRAGRGTHMPFGPHLSLGVLTALLFGDRILEAYLGLFGLA